MLSLAEQLRFEEAEVMKRRIHRLEEYQSRSTVVNTSVHDVDVYSIISDEKYAYVNMMRIKEGSIIYSFSNEIKKQLDETDEEILSTIIPDLHERTASTAKEAVLPFKVHDLPEEYLKQTIPSRGDRLQLLELSLRNVKAYQIQCRHQRALVDPNEGGMTHRNEHLLERIQKALQLPELPVNIECFDNSNIQGAFPVSAMVRFSNGKPNRKEYRKFNIKTVEGPDDYASMAEVIYRRYKRLSEEGKPLPQLLVVDGGRGQMEVAREVIQDQLQLEIPIAGLAKDDRHHTSELLYGFPPQVVGLKPTDPLFHLLEQIQNEVHRFAITFHKDKRSKGTFRTQLTDIPGIGDKTARDLLLKFGSVKEIKLQTEGDLAKVVGPAKAKAIIAYFATQQ
jgi:excinuclease ABC subunit C